MTPIRVGQIWERKQGGRKVRVTAVIDRVGVVELAPLGHGRPSRPMASTLRREYRLVEDAPAGEWP